MVRWSRASTRSSTAWPRRIWSTRYSSTSVVSARRRERSPMVATAPPGAQSRPVHRNGGDRPRPGGHQHLRPVRSADAGDLLVRLHRVPLADAEAAHAAPADAPDPGLGHRPDTPRERKVGPGVAVGAGGGGAPPSGARWRLPSGAAGRPRAAPASSCQRGRRRPRAGARTRPFAPAPGGAGTVVMGPVVRLVAGVVVGSDADTARLPFSPQVVYPAVPDLDGALGRPGHFRIVGHHHHGAPLALDGGRGR